MRTAPAPPDISLPPATTVPPLTSLLDAAPLLAVTRNVLLRCQTAPSPAHMRLAPRRNLFVAAPPARIKSCGSPPASFARRGFASPDRDRAAPSAALPECRT